MLKLLGINVIIVIFTFNIAAQHDQYVTGNNRSFFDYASEPVATVCQGNDLCQQELDALKVRNTRTHATLQKFMGVDLLPDNAPSIGVACSGGGLRASIATLGLLRGLEKIGILDAVNYTAGNSGSTWILASWLVHDKSLEQLTEYIKSKIRDTIDRDNFDKTALIHALTDKIKNLKPFSLNDIWGAWLAGGFFGTGDGCEHTITLADIAPKVASGAYPIPLFAATIGETAPCYHWAEFSPFKIGSEYLNTWINASDFGKRFDTGLSFDTSKTESFGYLLGLFGSLYAMSITDVIEMIQNDLEQYFNTELSLPFLSWLPWVNNVRISPPDVCNFAHNLPNCPLADEHYLTFVDAGFAFGLPFPALLRRNVQVYIVCDASSDVLIESANTMHKVQDYASKNNYPFPPIDYTTITKQKISVFADPANPAAPVIIYIPNFDSFSTFKASYTTEEFDQLMLGMEQAVTDNVETIKQALALKIMPHSMPLLTS